MTTDKFLHIFGRFLPTFALVISMTLRYIPLIKKRLKEINDAQTNFNSAKDNLFNKIKSALRNISILITWSLEKAIETADSMKSRGYGLKNRTNYSKYKLKKKDFVFIVTIVAIDLILIISLFKKSIYCFYNPYIMISRHTMFSAVSIVCFTILCFLPIFTDIKEELKWIRLKSKI